MKAGAASLLLLGCTSAQAVAPNANMALMQTTNEDTIRLPAEGGGSIELGPNATIFLDGVDVPASELYWTDQGLFRSTGELIDTWDSLGQVRVEQLNGAATVAATATAVVAVIALAGVAKGLGHGGSNSSGGHGGSSAAPPAPRSAPNPPVVDPTVPEVALRAADAAVRVPFIAAGQAPDQPGLEPGVPLFSHDARRRANIRLVARLEGAACWPGGGPTGDCIASGARVGVRLADVYELTAGVRAETETQLGATKPLAVAGFMLHGEVPSLHWLAIALGASVAFDAERAHVIPTFGVRFRPVRGLWLGLVPLQPVYATETGGWNMASGLEVTGEL